LLTGTPVTFSTSWDSLLDFLARHPYRALRNEFLVLPIRLEDVPTFRR
jgi:hypothetical protein